MLGHATPCGRWRFDDEAADASRNCLCVCLQHARNSTPTSTQSGGGVRAFFCRKEKTQTPLLCHNSLKREIPHATGGGHQHECARSDLPANAPCARTRSKGSPPAPRSPQALRCHCPETEGCRVRQLSQNMLAGHESGAHRARTESCPLGRPHAGAYRCDCRAAGSRPWR